MSIRYVKAKAGPHNSVIYTDSDGQDWAFEGGNRQWRNTNPGNVKPGRVSARNGAIGVAGPFSVFPDYESGHAAVVDSLKNTYGNSDIKQLAEGYAPRKENDTDKYIRTLQRRTGVFDGKKIKDFTPVQFEKLWKTIEQIEGWGKSIGKIRLLNKKAKILNVTQDRNGVITGYEIEGYGWVSKGKGISLTEQGKVDAIIAVSTAGHLFLRGRPGHAIS